MKQMFTLMDESALRFVQYFKNCDKDALDVELKDASSRFTNDIIATTAFGIECDSLENKTNEFYVMGKDITGAFNGLRGLIFFGFTLFPRVMKVHLIQHKLALSFMLRFLASWIYRVS